MVLKASRTSKNLQSYRILNIFEYFRIWKSWENYYIFGIRESIWHCGKTRYFKLSWWNWCMTCPQAEDIQNWEERQERLCILQWPYDSNVLGRERVGSNQLCRMRREKRGKIESWRQGGALQRVSKGRKWAKRKKKRWRSKFRMWEYFEWSSWSR